MWLLNLFAYLVLFTIVILAFNNQQDLNSSNSLKSYEVVGASMSPTILKGGTVYVNHDLTPEVDDVAVFICDHYFSECPESNQVVHRIIDSNETHFLTKGDNVLSNPIWVVKIDMKGKAIGVYNAL